MNRAGGIAPATGIDIRRLPSLSRPGRLRTAAGCHIWPGLGNRFLTIMSVMDSPTYSGALIGESLRPDATVEGIPLTATRIFRAALGDATAGQPQFWTVIEFEVAADS